MAPLEYFVVRGKTYRHDFDPTDDSVILIDPETGNGILRYDNSARAFDATGETIGVFRMASTGPLKLGPASGSIHCWVWHPEDGSSSLHFGTNLLAAEIEISKAYIESVVLTGEAKEAPQRKRFRVTWEIDIEADSAEEAALAAHEIQKRPDSTATVFIAECHRESTRTVVDTAGGVVTIVEDDRGLPPLTEMDDQAIDNLAVNALDAACASIQKALHVRTGDTAATFFSDDHEINYILRAYIKDELTAAEQEEDQE